MSAIELAVSLKNLLEWEYYVVKFNGVLFCTLPLWQMDYVRAREAGREAARYVIKRWPTIFPLMNPSKVSKKVPYSLKYWQELNSVIGSQFSQTDLAKN